MSGYSRLNRPYRASATSSSLYSSSLYSPFTDYNSNLSPLWTRSRLSDSGDVMSTRRSSNLDVPTSPIVPRRANRYARSNTTASVTQILTDGCSSLLQRIATRVRGPSANNIDRDRTKPKPTTNATIPELGSTRSRLEDKYSDVLEKLAKRNKDEDEHEKTVQPEFPKRNSLAKSATTSFANNYLGSFRTSRTPNNNSERHNSLYYSNYAEPFYPYLEHDSVYHQPRQKPAKPTPPRAHNSNYHKNDLRRSRTSNFFNKLYPVDIPNVDHLRSKSHKRPEYPSNETTPTNDSNNNVPTEITEREAKRKEIQSLIMKYSALDEAYNRSAAAQVKSIEPPPISIPVPQVSKISTVKPYQHHKDYYNKSNRLLLTVSRVDIVFVINRNCVRLIFEIDARRL